MSDTALLSATVCDCPASLAAAACPPAAAVSTLTVLLIGNYATDQQQSMQLFADLLARELPEDNAALRVETIRPEPFFGRIKPGADGLGKWLGYLDKFVVFPWRLRRKIAELKRAGTNFAVHICDHSSAPYCRHLRDVPHVVTCHDLLAIRSALGEIPASRTGWTGRVYQRFILRGLQSAARVVCVSEQTRADLLRITRLSRQHTAVIPMGLNHPYSPTPLPERRERLQKLLGDFAAPYILHVGGNQWYKNRTGVLKIYDALTKLGTAPKLVLAGKPLSEEMRGFLSNHPEVAAQVVVLTDVTTDDLCALYSGAELLLFPSLAEGFGWPVIEAQACGCRVVTSGRAPLTEIAGDAAEYFDPDQPEAAARVARDVLDESVAERGRRIRRGFENAGRFSAARMIRSYLATYQSLIS